MPTDYALECGPTTLAALAGLDRPEAARLLWPLRSFWWDTHRSRGEGHFGTPETALGDALVRHGFDVELWDGSGAFLADAPVYRRFLRRQAEHRAVDVAPLSPGMVATLAAVEAVGPAPVPTLPTLTEWLDRHQGGGRWACFVREPVAGPAGHVLPVAYGRALTNHDHECERYGDWLVFEALRVFPPPQET